jgi:uncharacterized protein YndB with AHSA1/START domain
MSQDRIIKVVELAAPVSRVWRALTDHKEFGQWFRVALDGPFKVGEVSTGRITYPGYEHVVWEAQIEAIEPERLFSMSWHPYAVDPDVDYSGEPKTLVEFRLEPTAKGTRLTITESGFSALPDARRRLEALRRNAGGWDEQARNIAAHVES